MSGQVHVHVYIYQYMQTLGFPLFQDFRDAFEIFDENKDGRISLDELRNMLIKVGQNPTESDLLRIMHAADRDSE